MLRLIMLTTILICQSVISYEDGELRNLIRETASKYYNSENIYDQFSGASSLIDLGEEEPLKFVVEQLFSGDFIIMRHAIDTLLSVSHPSAPDIISRAIERIDEGVFLKFLTESLSKRSRPDMYQILTDLVKSEDTWVVKHALQSIDMIEFNEKEDLLRSFITNYKKDDIILAYSYMGLAKFTTITNNVEKKLIEYAETGTKDTKEAAAIGLGRIDSKISREALRRLRNSNQPNVQIAALGSEVGLGLVEPRAKLLELILNGRGLDPTVAAASIRRIPREVAASITLELIECCELSSDVGARLLEAWAELGEPNSRILEWGISHKSNDIRMQAIWLVGILRLKGFEKELAAQLDDNDSGIATMAAWSLLRLIIKN